ncbi:MAG: hypothetical protein KDD61_09360 [Bdellovibrionales bacterium]|nr:hypothetical protein [Bdellovibrionales bacterium]
MAHMNPTVTTDKILTGSFAGNSMATPSTESPEQPSLEREQVVSELSVLDQLNANLYQLEDLTGRMRFIMREVHSLIRK